MSTPLETWLEKAKKFDVYDKPAVAEYTLQEAIAVIEKLKEALESLDKAQSRQTCNASVYEINDDDFGFMQFFVQEALAIDPEKL